MDFKSMKYGFFVHYVWGGSAYIVTINADGSRPTGLNDVADRFDAIGLADDLASFGVEYVVFTAFHAAMNCLYPSVKMNQWISGHTSDRDVIRDMIGAVKNKGIKVFLYTHPRDGHDLSESEQIATGWGTGGNGAEPNFTAFDFAKWNDFINDIYEELMDRYGSDIEGVYIDEGSELGDSHKVVDYPRLRHTIKSRNPNLIMIQNYYGNVYSCDMGDKEYSYWGEFASLDGDSWPAYANMPVSSVMGGQFWANTPQGQSAVKFSAESLYRYTVLQAGANLSGGGTKWAAGPYPDGGWEDGVATTMQQVGRYIATIAESIKDTYPSTSFLTVQGDTIHSIRWGVATKSTDDRLEYIHVLKAPENNTLILPAPADGKWFDSASLLSNGHIVALTQNENQITLTLHGTDAWDPNNTVIKLRRLL